MSANSEVCVLPCSTVYLDDLQQQTVMKLRCSVWAVKLRCTVWAVLCSANTSRDVLRTVLQLSHNSTSAPAPSPLSAIWEALCRGGVDLEQTSPYGKTAVAPQPQEDGRLLLLLLRERLGCVFVMFGHVSLHMDQQAGRAKETSSAC